ncbi:MAG: heavy metal translocating P-type ATPase [Lachnospiraceae bacterium]|nr:heavy metal translocating P-type ATPase [Lachnospiraceae bacterium]
MKCRIMHESPGRLRVRMLPCSMTVKEADILEFDLRNISFVSDVRVYERTGDAVICYAEGSVNRQKLIRHLSHFAYTDPAAAGLVPEKTGRELNRQYEEKLVMKIAWRVLRRLLVPAPVRNAFTVLKSLRYLRTGLRLLAEGKLQVPVLDAAAITASVLRRDYPTASSVMFLLETGELLEEWTHRKSVDDLARSMSLRVDRVWMKNGEEEVLVPVKDVREGDRILVRTSNVIPLDGRVISGAAMVNQAAMTGESVPVEKQAGGYVYAGTVVENGECLIEVTKKAGSGKYDQIVRMIEESEKLKSETETAAFHLADRLVPFSLAGSVLTYLLTRNLNRALAFLMVDYSCALKLSMPLSVLSAIREAGQHGITVKGGKFLEAAARAQTIVFDKTGTLTHAQPQVVRIVTFGGADENECLRMAACLEEHYPHSIANAVVKEAEKRGLIHEERHSTVNYVVAHGIASEIDGQKAVIGSWHFVFEDEHCTVPPGGEEALSGLPAEYSHLFLAVGGVLRAVLCIFDPLREEAPYVIEQLHRLGISRICMMTGDNERTAAAAARSLSIDEYHAGVLPEDKAGFIRREHEAGRKVIMIGDGINDTPALSEADAGVAISDGAAIAREIADITISADDLLPLLKLREISMALMDRIDSNYRFIMGFNTMLILLGVLGILPPASSALLHNGSTIAAGLRSMTRLLPEQSIRKQTDF